MRPGDLFLFYHTGDERAVVGVGRIVSEPYPDPTDSEGRWGTVDVEPLYRFRTPVTLADVKADPRFADWALVRQLAAVDASGRSSGLTSRDGHAAAG